MNFTGNNTSTITLPNNLLHNISCESPHNEVPKLYTYILDDGFIAFLIITSIINFISMIPTTVLNVLIIIGFVQQRSLRTTSNRLLFSICTADVVVGILIEPIFAVHVLQISKESHNCGLANFLVYTVPVTIVITMVTHLVIALERYTSTRHLSLYQKVFTKRYITWFIALIWIACSFCFILPFLTGDPILGTRIIVTLILVSLAVCSFCYISLYQDFKWQDGKPTAEIKGAYVIRRTEPVNRSETEKGQFQRNIKLSAFYFKLFLCMLIFYILNLTKSALNSYEVFTGNGYYVFHFVFDTFLFLNALVNPILILYYNPEVAKAATMVYKSEILSTSLQ